MYHTRKVIQKFWGQKGSIAINQELRQTIRDKRRHHRKRIRSISRENETNERNDYSILPLSGTPDNWDFR